MRVHLTNLGCKLNQAESEALARRFVAAGHRLVKRLEEADLHVVNSCTVTHAAARDSRKAARRGGRLGRRVRTVLTGCHVAVDPAAAARLAGVDLVVPNEEKERLVERLHEAFPEAGVLGAEGPVPVPWVPLEFGNSRALVKIEDGCDMRCAFCVIPLTRGRQQSRPSDEVVREVAGLAAGGHAEVVVTGVQISSYRDGAGGLYELVRRLLDETPVRRLRLTSIAPWQFDRRLLELLAGGRVCRHFHLSLQSGCDATLRRMRRPYDGRRFARLVEKIRSAAPGVAITTDVIAGFPGESDEEFAESLAFCRRMQFARLHAFPFSARPGTGAATLPDQLSAEVKRQRMAALLEVARRSRRRFESSQVGTRAEVLWERRRRGRWLGTTDNYLAVSSAEGGPAGALRPARLAAGSRGLVALPAAGPLAAAI